MHERLDLPALLMTHADLWPKTEEMLRSSPCSSSRISRRTDSVIRYLAVETLLTQDVVYNPVIGQGTAAVCTCRLRLRKADRKTFAQHGP